MKVIRGQMMTSWGLYGFWPITFDRIEIETSERCPKCSPSPDESYDMQHDLPRSLRDLDLRSRSKVDL